MSEFWTSADIRRHYGIARTQLWRWRQHEDFPPSLKEVDETGGLWRSEDVKAWRRKHLPVKQQKMAGLAGRYAQCGDLKQVAREFWVSEKTALRWLRECGVLPPPSRRVRRQRPASLPNGTVLVQPAQPDTDYPDIPSQGAVPMRGPSFSKNVGSPFRSS